MSSTTIGLLVFAGIFGAGLFGMLLRTALPAHHLNAATQDTVKLSMGLVGTMAALVLGLLVASTKDVYDTEKSGVIQMAAKIVFLDRMLENYGPETAAVRNLLRLVAERMVDHTWPDAKAQGARIEPRAFVAEGAALYDAMQTLSPQNDKQQSIKPQALSTIVDVGQMRWLLLERVGTSIATPMLVIVVSWLALIFISFGLFAPTNTIAVTSLLVAALSVSGAIFLILELDQPFDGLLQISSAPVRNALIYLGN